MITIKQTGNLRLDNLIMKPFSLLFNESTSRKAKIWFPAMSKETFSAAKTFPKYFLMLDGLATHKRVIVIIY